MVGSAAIAADQMGEGRVLGDQPPPRTNARHGKHRSPRRALGRPPPDCSGDGGQEVTIGIFMALSESSTLQRV